MRCRVLSASDSSNSESPWGRGGLDAMAGTGQSWDWEWQAGPRVCSVALRRRGSGAGVGAVFQEVPEGPGRGWPWSRKAWRRRGWEPVPAVREGGGHRGRSSLDRGDESPVVLGPVGLRGDSAFMLSSGATAGSGVGEGLALAWVGLSRALVLGRAPPVGRADPGGRHDGGRPCRAELSVADLPVGVGLRGGEDDRLRARVSVWR